MNNVFEFKIEYLLTRKKKQFTEKIRNGKKYYTGLHTGLLLFCLLQYIVLVMTFRIEQKLVTPR